MCGSRDLKLFLDLGSMALANSFLSKSTINQKEDKFPLRVFYCQNCSLVQLIDIVNPDLLFRSYVYFSSGMPVLPDHFKKYAQDIIKSFTNSTQDLVVEIGSNDGLLLAEIKKMKRRILGVDPAINIAKQANKNGIETLPDFFNERLAKKIVKKYGKAQAIIGNNVVAHINDHHDLVKAVKVLLTDTGVFVFEVPYLVDMFENLTFDTIYHEHLSYLAVRPLNKFFESYGMEVFDVQVYPVQGNSIRVFVGFKAGHKISPRVSKLIAKEKSLGLDKFDTYQKLAQKIKSMKEDVLKTLRSLKKQNKTIIGYGAPAKGNTLLNFYGIDSKYLDYVTEALPSKIGLYTPGTHLKVTDIDQSRKTPPDYYLLLAWNYKDNILKKEFKYRKTGGKFIMPVGDQRII